VTLRVWDGPAPPEPTDGASHLVQATAQPRDYLARRLPRQSANAFAQQHDGGEDASRAYAHLSEPLFIAGVVALAIAIAGLALHHPPVLSANVMAIAAAGVAVTIAACVHAS
jgi:hypothetical protein